VCTSIAFWVLVFCFGGEWVFATLKLGRSRSTVHTLAALRPYAVLTAFTDRLFSRAPWTVTYYIFHLPLLLATTHPLGHHPQAINTRVISSWAIILRIVCFQDISFLIIFPQFLLPQFILSRLELHHQGFHQNIRICCQREYLEPVWPVASCE